MAFFLLGALSAQAQLQRPAITSIRQERTNIVVTASVPAGIQRVVLESRDRFGAAAWVPRAVARPNASGGSCTFRLPGGRSFEALRVRADATDPLPAFFYSGQTNFLSESNAVSDPSRYGLTTMDGLGIPGAENAAREVVESDIWQRRGQTLYFFNQYRGLQVIDIANPEAAVIRGTLAIPAAGEQMYLLGSNHVVLLARNGCGNLGEESQVLVVSETQGTPAVVARLPVSGYILESRMVGTALYVASQTMQPVPSTNTYSAWEWGTMVSSFDLANPDVPVSRGTLWYSGYGNVVAATDVYLFVGTQDPTNWWQSIVRLIDITAVDGTMSAYDSIRTAGRVTDKFKLDYTGGIFTSISEDWHWNSGTRLVTKLETFRLPDPRSMGPRGVVKLGELELGRGERLHATRFDGNRVYVVTFFQIDPLWVVDLSNPSAPRIAGSLDVPGWSTYIQPLGNRLVSIGVETNRVAVSLFDVQDPASPALLSRVRLGENYSWSEANYDEKAFSVFPEAGLILVPYNGCTSNGYAMRVQLIDLATNSLTARGVIEHQFQPRRTTLYSRYILSLSGWELLCIDAADRDHPQVRGNTELAWPVDRVVVHGDYLVQINTASGWWGIDPDQPSLLVTPSAAPEQVLARLSLTNLPVLGVAQEGDRLYIVQGPSYWWYGYMIPLAAGDNSTNDVSPASRLNSVLTVIDLGSLPALQIAGQVAFQSGFLGGGANLRPVFPKPELLVWVGSETPFCIYDVGMSTRGGYGLWWPYWGGFGGRLLAFDVANPAQPQFASEFLLGGSNYWWSYSPAFTADGLVYLSHQSSEFIPGLITPWQSIAQTNITVDATTGQMLTNIVPAGTWMTRDYLDVVDYADPQNPTARKPVNISGTLNGLSHNGALLYTVGRRGTMNYASSSATCLDALAYDGVSAHLVASLPLPGYWYDSVLVLGTNIFVRNPGSSTASNSIPPTLKTWTLNPSGKFVQLGRVTLAMPAYQLVALPSMLAAQESDQTIEIFSLSDPAALRRIGLWKPESCLWSDITKADGDASRGLWLPMGAYGVVQVPLTDGVK